MKSGNLYCYLKLNSSSHRQHAIIQHYKETQKKKKIVFSHKYCLISNILYLFVITKCTHPLIIFSL